MTFAGSGSAFVKGGNFQSNMVLDAGTGKKLLFDCGGDARLSLDMLGLTHRDITDVFISHLHADHIGGLEWLAFCTYFDQACERPRLHVSNDLADELWARSLSGGLSSIQGEVANLETYFDVDRIEHNGKFIWGDVAFQLVQSIHVINGFSVMPSYGLMFEADGVKVYVTADTQFCPHQIEDFYAMADVVFHDCETAPFHSRVHAHYEDLRKLPKATKGKMWLYHYQPDHIPDTVKDGFRGFVKKGQRFDFSNPQTF